MAKKLHQFSELVGHENLITFLKDHLEKGTLPQFILFEGDEGLGKSTLAKLLAYYLTGERPEVAQRVIDENRATEDVLLYNMSINGGKDTAKDVETNLSLGLSNYPTKVIICDEAHGMSDAAQDVFLVSTEFLPKGVYLFMCTTDSQNLKPTLKSRAFTLHLNHLTNKEMTTLLASTAEERGLKIQAQAATLQMIAAWADGKPRVALNLLEGFAQGSAVSQDVVKELIDYLSVDDILPILTSFNSSMTQGLSYISEMKLNTSFVPLLVEILKIQTGAASFKVSYTDTHRVREALREVPADAILKFTYLVAGMQKPTRSGLISAYLQSHPGLTNILHPADTAEVIRSEMDAKFAAPAPEVEKVTMPAAPTLDDLLQKGVQLSG